MSEWIAIGLSTAEGVHTELVESSTIYEGEVGGHETTIAFRSIPHKRMARMSSSWLLDKPTTKSTMAFSPKLSTFFPHG